MSERRARMGLLVTAALFVPLPYMIVGDGYVPLVRFGMLAAVSTSYSALIDGTGVAWAISGLLLAHLTIFGALLAAAVTFATRRIPPTRRRAVVVSTFVLALLISSATPAYRTPFAATGAYGTWLSLFR